MITTLNKRNEHEKRWKTSNLHVLASDECSKSVKSLFAEWTREVWGILDSRSSLKLDFRSVFRWKSGETQSWARVAVDTRCSSSVLEGHSELEELRWACLDCGRGLVSTARGLCPTNTWARVPRERAFTGTFLWICVTEQKVPNWVDPPNIYYTHYLF